MHPWFGVICATMTYDLQPHRYVLYIDDEAQAVKYFQDIFGTEFPVLTTTTVQEAQAIVQARGAEIAVIISDQRMPSGSGVALLREVHQKFPDIIRVLTTAYASVDTSVQAINQGRIFAYVTKPWDIDSMQATLHSAYREFDKRQAFLAAAASIAHELRTPLSIMASYAEQIASALPELQQGHGLAVSAQLMQSRVDVQLVERLPQLAQKMHKEMHCANTLIDVMLASQRAMDVKDFSQLSVRACVNEALQRYPFTGNEGKRVHTDLAHDFDFFGLPDMFSFVLFNLLKNALWAIKAAGKGEITLATFATEQHHVLACKDTGSGIPAEVVPHIFEAFYSTKKSSGGTGVGLAFCQRVMHAFGAKIHCESVQGQHTTFLMTFARESQKGQRLA